MKEHKRGSPVERRPTTLSLFSGAGGMDVGLESAGFDTVACIEIDEIARATLARNRPEWSLWGSGDIHDADAKLEPSHLGLEPGELDLISGGPPCQPFSAAAQWASSGRKGMGDIRATTVHALIGLTERFLPRALLIENVQGFITGANSAREYLESQFSRINGLHHTSYSLMWNVLNAADFGVAQNRRRVIALAFRDPVDWSWPSATHATHQVSVGEALHGLQERELPKPQGKWAGLLPSIPAGKNYQWLTSQGGGEELFGHRTKYWNFLLKLDPSAPSWTLPASPGPSTGPFHWDDRPLSPRESMRIQSFPDSWKLEGDTRAQIKQIGNATPPLLAEVLGLNLRRTLDDVELSMAPSLQIPHRNLQIRASEPLRVPSAYRHLVGEKAAHPGRGHGPAARTESASEAE